MVHDLIIRGFDDKIHAQLGKLANQKGVSINSIVKDAVDKWLKQQQSQLPRKHHLVIHSDDDSIIGLIKSMDRLAKEGDLFRCFCAPPGSQSSTSCWRTFMSKAGVRRSDLRGNPSR